MRGSHIHILGAAYKRNIDDVRESPALDIIMILRKLGAKITFSDPYVKRIELQGEVLESQDMLSCIRAADCVALITDHSGVDYSAVVENSKLIVDTRNALKSFRSPNIIRL